MRQKLQIRVSMFLVYFKQPKYKVILKRILENLSALKNDNVFQNDHPNTYYMSIHITAEHLFILEIVTASSLKTESGLGCHLERGF